MIGNHWNTIESIMIKIDFNQSSPNLNSNQYYGKVMIQKYLLKSLIMGIIPMGLIICSLVSIIGQKLFKNAKKPEMADFGATRSGFHKIAKSSLFYC